ncbi:MAG: SIMPL domain-containing protein [bacterium]
MIGIKNNKLSFTTDYKIISAVLLIIIIVMTIVWKPWQSSSSTVRKISVSGQATIKSVPDEFVLSPYFEYTNADRAKASDELSKQSTSINAKLKEIGVKDEQIKSSTSGYDRFYGYPTPADSSANTLQFQLTITLNDKDVAQKVQDYLLTLKPKGQISPAAQFSESKKKELQDQSRTKAIDDAKSKAQKSASQLGSKLGVVITISEGNSYGTPIAYSGLSSLESKTDSSAVSVPVQTGQNDFSYVVSVEYELK